MRTFSLGRRSFAVLLFPLALVFLSLIGCGGGKVGNVSGTVTYKKEPLPNGDISFVSQVGEKKVVHGKIQDGKYSLSGVPAGAVKITVQTYPPRKPAPLPPGMKPLEPTGTEPPAPTGKYVPIPQKYGSPDTSGLEYTATSGDQKHDVPLTP